VTNQQEPPTYHFNDSAPEDDEDLAQTKESLQNEWTLNEDLILAENFPKYKDLPKK
jgi:adenine-specific DNA methylase